ncbi:MAG: STAS domain-containing protein [Chitinophagales bacterium]|mgnify:CR=1 FL=1|jgi:anti-anti-sigma factor|nr:STAS domain-containing protein [Bacteroidota bacterium]MBX7141009.1 STAS domain-containing protein [Chitinophagales bacterium]
MKFSVDKQEKFCVFTLGDDRLNSQVGPLLKSEMILLNAEGFRNIIFDMTAIKYVDSSGLSAILISDRLCKNAGGTFVITGANDQVKRLLQISQLDSVLNITPTLQEAKDLIVMEEIERDFNDTHEHDV